jgi:hypothetical protein
VTRSSGESCRFYGNGNDERLDGDEEVEEGGQTGQGKRGRRRTAGSKQTNLLASTLGAGSLSQIETLLQQFERRPSLFAVAAGTLVGVYWGYTQHAENIPSCERVSRPFE